MDLAGARASLEATDAALGGRDAAWEAVLHAVAVGAGLDDGPVHPATAGWAVPGAEALLAPVREGGVDRGASGTFYTPGWLVEWVLDRALDGLGDRPDRAPVILDPACGCGAFVVPAVRRLAARSGRSPAQAALSVHGVDLDPVAVAICRLLLRVAAPDLDAAVAADLVRVGDGLTDPLSQVVAGPEVVVGNPPFLGQLRRRTVRARAGSGPAAYTDTSGLFLRRALEMVAPGGRVALVQPLSVLAARDAAPVRAALTTSGALSDLWAASRPVFPGADVLVCVPVVHRGEPQGRVRTWQGSPTPEPGPVVALPRQEWGPLAAPAYGVPPVALPATTGVLADLGPCTADFRDQYYGLVPHVRERDDVPPDRDVAPLVTAGVVDPAVSRWGTRPTRYARREWVAPVVDLTSLRADTDHPSGARLERWSGRRLTPKVLVATQGRVLEAVVDEDGTWLPSVPVLTLVPAPDRLWHALAVLLAPPVVAHAVGWYLGTAMSPGSVKLSAVQCGRLPLPVDADAWDEGAGLARAAQRAGTGGRLGPGRGQGDDARRADLVDACAATMSAAYGLAPGEAARVHGWWRERAGGRRRTCYSQTDYKEETR